MDANGLAAFSRFVGGRGCVVRHGAIVYTWGDAARRGDVASACKPWFTHFLLKALEDGKIKSVDEPVARLEPGLERLNEPLGYKDRRITWRHLATQTSCYGITEAPGAAFCYNDWQMAMFWDLLFLKVYGATYDTVDEQVLRPLLTDVIQCEDRPTMMAFGPGDRAGRVGVSPRDFCRFGLLYLHKGNWNGRQLLGERYAAMAVSSPLPNSLPRAAGKAAEMLPGQRSLGSTRRPDNQCDHLGSYSWLWWTNGIDRDGRRHWPDAPEDTYGCFGHGGPRVMIVIPSLDLVMSWNDANVKSRQAENQAFKLLAASVLGEAGKRPPSETQTHWPAIREGRYVQWLGRTWNTRKPDAISESGGVGTLGQRNATGTYLGEGQVNGGTVELDVKLDAGYLAPQGGGKHFLEILSWLADRGDREAIAARPWSRIELDNLGDRPRCIVWNYGSQFRGEATKIMSIGPAFEPDRWYHVRLDWTYREPSGSVAVRVDDRAYRAEFEFVDGTLGPGRFFAFGHVETTRPEGRLHCRNFVAAAEPAEAEGRALPQPSAARRPP
jgi:hypothetical protein